MSDEAAKEPQDVRPNDPVGWPWEAGETIAGAPAVFAVVPERHRDVFGKDVMILMSGCDVSRADAFRVVTLAAAAPLLAAYAECEEACWEADSMPYRKILARHGWDGLETPDAFMIALRRRALTAAKGDSK